MFLIKKKKCKKSSVATAALLVATVALLVALHGLPKADVGKGSNTEPGIPKPVAPFHHSHWIALVVNNLLQTFHGRPSSEFSYKLLINTTLCCVSL